VLGGDRCGVWAAVGEGVVGVGWVSSSEGVNDPVVQGGVRARVVRQGRFCQPQPVRRRRRAEGDRRVWDRVTQSVKRT
jgi:hypothetical protein